MISKGAVIHETAEIGEVRIAGGFKYLSVGRQTFLGRIKMNIHERVAIGNNVCINDGVELLTASHDVCDPNWGQVKAAIFIEDYVWIGTGAMILPGVRIGKGAVIGARAVVSKTVAPGRIVVGNPAKVLDRSRSDKLSYNPCEFLAANRAWLIG
ncbi:acyltransferase [Segetibacter sp. 3557_3]|uniref:acyltransferase n=1 Tax=Segetibacter sp. 3557_3 TaxID=2547429 RepID=UPI002938F4CF|nr:acyltransferase [Segetibacter sp. 3557_3]